MKYYQIREFETSHPESHDGVVSEKEMERRIDAMITGRLRDGLKAHQLVPILLHGKGEKYEEKPWPGPEDIIKMRGKPSPAPTREEWKKWAESAVAILFPRGYYREGSRMELKTALLSMPIVPKE